MVMFPKATNNLNLRRPNSLTGELFKVPRILPSIAWLIVLGTWMLGLELWATDEDEVVRFQEFAFVNNTVYSDEELASLLVHFLGQPLTSIRLEQARRTLTEYYISNGYINSGAFLPDQRVSSGKVRFVLVEGELSRISVQGVQRMNPGFFNRRVLRSSGQPLNFDALKGSLSRLQRHPAIRSVSADLQPVLEDGQLKLGESLLDLKIREEQPFQLATRIHNQRPPNVGAEEIELRGAYWNLAGLGDELAIRYGIARRADEGAEFSAADRVRLSYRIPVSASDTTLELRYQRSDFAVIEAPFQSLDIESESERYGVLLRHPVYRDHRDEVGLSLLGEVTQVESFLAGVPFSFSPGAVAGESNVSALRLGGDWTRQSTNQVFSARVTASFGFDWLGATMGTTDRDGEFVSFAGQFQHLRNWMGWQWLTRTSFQWSDDPLLSPEQYPLGGFYTVRGYRENQLVRDRAVLASMELRVPIWKRRAGRQASVQLAPFIDFGAGWNSDRVLDQPRTLASAGVGLIFRPKQRIDGRLYWGHGFREFDSNEDDLQDHGLHFELNVRLF